MLQKSVARNLKNRPNVAMLMLQGFRKMTKMLQRQNLEIILTFVKKRKYSFKIKSVTKNPLDFLKNLGYCYFFKQKSQCLPKYSELKHIMQH